MTFQADIQRQAYRADYTALGASLSPSPSLSGEERAPATERGSVHGFALQTVADPLAELSDSLEELTFQFEEGEMKDIGERELGETRQRRGVSRITAIEQWRELLPDMPDSEVIARLLRRVRGAMAGGGGVSPEELLRWLGESTSDPTCQDAVLACLEETVAGGGEADEPLTELFGQARARLEREQGPAIRAGYNLAGEINRRADSPSEMQGMRDLYRGEVLGFTTPQDCFRSLLASRGPGRLAESIDFLVAGCGADLQATTPSTSPEELRRILLDLQCVEVLRTVYERLDRLGVRMQRQFGETVLLSAEKMTGRVMDMTQQNFVGQGALTGLVSACGLRGLPTRLDFMRELYAIIQSLSPRLFAEEADRFALLRAAQDYLDELIGQEEGEAEGAEEPRRQDRSGQEAHH